MKLKITSLALALISTSFGATVTLSSVGGNYDGTDDYGILKSNLSPVAQSAGTAQVIFFPSLSDAQVTTFANAGDYDSLFGSGNFTSILSDDFTGIVSAYGATPGFFQGSESNYVTPALLNKTLYAYFTSGTEVGLFRSGQTIVTDGAAPALPGTYGVLLSDGTPVLGAFGADYVVPGAYALDAALTNVSVNSFVLIETAAIPEPSVAVMGALGALGLLRRRRN